jgi:hypothetical protein
LRYRLVIEVGTVSYGPVEPASHEDLSFVQELFCFNLETVSSFQLTFPDLLDSFKSHCDYHTATSIPTVGKRKPPMIRLAKVVSFCVLAALAISSFATRPVSAVPVTDGMVLWLDATDASTLFKDAALTMPALNGDPIGGWMDKSGSGYHATQATEANQPVRNDTAMNGLAAVRFSAAEADGMTIDDGLVVNRPYTAFIVNQYYGDTRGRTLQSRDANWLHGLWSGTVSSYADGFIGGNPVAEVNFPYVVDTTGQLDSSTMYANGLDFTVTPTPVGQPGRLGLVSGGMFPLEVSDADISEVVIYNRVLTGDELTQVRNFLYTKYNATILQPPAPTNTVLRGSIGTFAGGDSGEGLDFSGNFAYAVNVGGPGGSTVGDAVFTDGSEAGMAGGASPGATVTDANEIGNWHAPAYGDSANDDGLETVLQSIRWNTPPGVSIDLEVQPNQPYKLQLLFAESCCNRGFDITIEGELAVDNFNVQVTQGGINNVTQGVFFSDTVVSSDGVLNILLGGSNPLAPDNNAIINGLTLEVVPEPSSLILTLLAVVGMCLSGRRRVP